MSTAVSVILTALLGWLAGGAANWAADVLPVYGAEPVFRSAWRVKPVALLHHLTLPWYAFRRGLCPHCGTRRPRRAPLVELACMAGYIASRLLIGNNPTGLLLAALYLPFLLAVIAIDVEHRRVLNIMLAPAAVISLGLSFLPGRPTPLEALVGGAVGFGLFLLISLIGRGKMGAGDVKLAGVIGLIVGFPGVLMALAIGIIVGGLAALLLVVTRRAGLKSYIAYAPYLCIGALAVLARTLVEG